MIINTYIRKLQERFARRESVDSDELFSFFKEWEPELKLGTFRSRIHELKQKGILQTVRRGVFTLQAKPVFWAMPSRTGLRVYKRVIKEYPQVKACVWNTAALSNLMLHQPASSYDLLEVEGDAFELVWGLAMTDTHLGLPINGHQRSDFEYIEFNNEMIPRYFIKRLLSRAPIHKREGHEYVVPTLEKILVDLFSEPELFSTFAGSEFSIILENAYHRYAIDFARLLQYAQRRNKAEELKHLIITTTDIPHKLLT